MSDTRDTVRASGEGGADHQQVLPRLVQRQRRQAALAKRLTPTGCDSVSSLRLEKQFVVRESSLYEYALLEKMIEQTLTPYADIPEVARMLQVGHRVMLRGQAGDKTREELGAQWLYAAGSTRPVAVLVVLGRYGFVYGLTSASKANTVTGDDNAWVNAVADQLQRLRPKHLVTGPFSRLVRNADFSGTLAKPVRRLGIRVHPAEAPRGFALSEGHGDLMWTMLTNAAHQDWLTTVTRLLTGTLFELINGRLPHSAKLPLGYRFAPSTRGCSAVEPNPDAIALVRDFITWAASDLTLREIAQRLGERGVCARGPSDFADPRPIHTVADPESAVRTLLQHLPTYIDGAYPYHYTCPLPGLKELHGQTIHRDDEAGPGEFRFTLQFGVPAGGWCDPEILQAAIRRRLAPTTDSSRPPMDLSPDRKPLSGIGRWQDQEHQYRLDSHDDSYTLRRRPVADAVDAAGKPAAWPHYTGDLLGRFHPRDLHRAVAHLLRDLASHATTDAPCPQHDGDLDLAALAAQADDHDRRAGNARDLAAAARSTAERDQYAEDARIHLAEAHRLRAVVHEATSRQRLSTATSMTADVPRLLALAEFLDRCDGRAPIDANQAVRQIIRNLRIDAQPGHPQATVTMRALVRTEQGYLTLGPASAPVRNTTMRPRRNGAHPRLDRDRVLTAAVINGDPDGKGLLDAEGMDKRARRRRALAVICELLPSGGAASAVLDCPIPAVRIAVLAEDLPGLNTQAAVHLDPGLVAELQSVYHDPDFPGRGWSWAHGDPTAARIAVGWVHRWGADGIRVDHLRAATGLGDPVLHALLSTNPNHYRLIRTGDAQVLQPTTPWTPRAFMRPEDRQIRLVPCPHCGGPVPWQLLRVNEIPDGILCPQCLKTPSTDFPYPADYLQPWVGPHQGRRALKASETHEPLGTHAKPFLIPPRHRRV